MFCIIAFYMPGEVILQKLKPEGKSKTTAKVPITYKGWDIF